MSDLDPDMAAFDRLNEKPAAPTIDPDMAAFDAIEDDQRTHARIKSRQHTPDQYGEARRIGAKQGIPPQVAVENLDTIREDEQRSEFDGYVANSPALRKWTQKVENVGVAQDDLGNLKILEDALTSLKRGFTSALRGFDAQSVQDSAEILTAIDEFERTGKSTSRFASLFAGVGGKPENVALLRTASERRLAENAIEFARRGGEIKKLPASPEYQAFQETDTLGGALSAFGKAPVSITSQIVAESFGQMAPTLPLVLGGGIVGGARALAGATGLTSFGAEYTNSLAGIFDQLGVDMNDQRAVQAAIISPEFQKLNRQALVKAGVVGAFDAATAGVAGVKIGKNAITNVAAQTGVQAAGGAAGEAAGSAASGQEVNPAAVLAEAIGEAPGGVVDVATLGVNRALGRKTGDMVDVLVEFPKDQKALDDVTKAAKDAKTSDRSPEAMEEFVRDAGADGSIYVDTEQARTYFQSKGLDPIEEMVALTGDRDAVLEAVAAGGDLIIPVDRYAARVVKSPHADEIRRLARIAPDRLSQADMESPELAAQVDALVAEAAPEAQTTDPIYETFYAQAKAAGRSESESQTLAALITERFKARAEGREQGETPQQLLEATPLTISREGQQAPAAGARTLTQEAIQQAAAETVETPEFKTFFGDSKVVDTDGKPLVVYHGTQADFDAFREDTGWFTWSPSQADMFGGINAPGTNVVPAYLSIKNPVILQADEASRDSVLDSLAALEKDQDGVLVMEDGNVRWAVVRSPTQIKSVFNKGTFDAADPRILYQPAATETINADSLMKQFTDAKGSLDAGAAGDYIRQQAKAALDAGGTVTLHVEGKARPIKAVSKLGLVDENGNPWGAMAVLSALPGDPARVEITNPTAAPAAKVGPGPRAFIQIGKTDRRIVLREGADKSSTVHELGHLFLEEMVEDAKVSPRIAKDLEVVLQHIGVESAEKFVEMGDEAAALQAKIASENREPAAAEAKRLDELAAPHEKFADTFVNYLRTAKAPSIQLRSVFRRFKAWLTKFAQWLGSQRFQFSDDMRQVLDRLIATDEAIADSASQQDFKPVLPADEMRRLGVTPARASGYQAVLERAKEELTKKLMADLERRQDASYRELLAKHAKDVTEETTRDPVYNAIEIMARGKRLDGQEVPPGLQGAKFNRDELTDPALGYGVSPTTLQKFRALGIYSADEGMSADLMAQMMGFESGDALISAIDAAPPRKAYIADEAKRRADAERPDTLTDGSLEVEAMKALHNSRMWQALQSELDILGELAGQPQPSARVIREAARQIIAEKTQASARPNQYLVQERKAARLATVAASAGRYAEAAMYKRRQVLNAALYREAQQAQEDITKLSTLMRRLGKKSTRENIAQGGQGFLIQLDQMRHVYGYAELSPQRLADWQPLAPFLDGLQALGEVTAVSDRVLAAVDAKQVQAQRDLKISELRELYDAAKNLRHLAGQMNRVRKGDVLVKREEAIAELKARAEQSGLKVKPLPRSRRELDTKGEVGRSVSNMAMDLLRPENIIEMLDGGETGPWHDYWLAALQRSEDSMNAYRRRIGDQLKTLRKATPKDFLAGLDRSVEIAPGVTLKRATLVAAMLNSGNAGNLQRLANGGITDVNNNPVKLTERQIIAMRESLTDQELDYMQGLWDTVNSLWPDIVAMNQRVSGVPIDKVEAQSFTVRGKTYRGGYWPLVYDHLRSNVGETQVNDDALRVLMGQGFTQAATSKGYQKARVDELEAALLLDFGSVISRHLDQVMTDLSYRESVKHISSLLRSSTIKQVLLDRVGESGYHSLKGQLAYSVSASSGPAGLVSRDWRRFADTLLANASVSALAIRPDIALGNYTSALVQGMDRTGLRGMLRGLWQANIARTDTRELIKAKSPFMAARLEETDHNYQQELRWTEGKSGFGPAYKRMMMTLHRAAAFEVEKALWTGRYLNERGAGKSEAEAIALADKTIRQTQTANERKDLSTFERDTAFKQTRQFMGPMFVIYGRMNEAARGHGNSQQVGERAARIFLQVFLAPAIFALAAGRWPEEDKDDDDEEIAAGEWGIWLAVNTLLFPLQTLPLLREAGTAAEALLTDKPINPRAAPTAQAIGAMAKAGKGIAKKIEDYQDTEELDYLGLTRDLVNLVGPLTGLPTSQIRITTKGIDAALDDDAEDQNLARLMLYGPPK